ncbi:MAG: hypothetical protein IBJ11_06690 [Phycisphaerales bacterium]|nr:hypothetical protein [Phycisphaerales bacterium]
MAERVNADHGLVDAWTANLGGPRTAALLERLDRAVAWDSLVQPIAALPEYRGGEKGGRPAWPALTMLKCMLLAKWFGLPACAEPRATTERTGLRPEPDRVQLEAEPDPGRVGRRDRGGQRPYGGRTTAAQRSDPPVHAVTPYHAAGRSGCPGVPLENTMHNYTKKRFALFPAYLFIRSILVLWAVVLLLFVGGNGLLLWLVGSEVLVVAAQPGDAPSAPSVAAPSQSVTSPVVATLRTEAAWGIARPMRDRWPRDWPFGYPGGALFAPASLAAVRHSEPAYTLVVNDSNGVQSEIMFFGYERAPTFIRRSNYIVGRSEFRMVPLTLNVSDADLARCVLKLRLIAGRHDRLPDAPDILIEVEQEKTIRLVNDPAEVIEDDPRDLISVIRSWDFVASFGGNVINDSIPIDFTVYPDDASLKNRPVWPPDVAACFIVELVRRDEVLASGHWVLHPRTALDAQRMMIHRLSLLCDRSMEWPPQKLDDWTLRLRPDRDNAIRETVLPKIWKGEVSVPFRVRL